MGQRSQIYVKYTDEKGKTRLCGRYFQWLYGVNMISRARHSIEWLMAYREYPYEIPRKLPRILETNFDLRDVTDSCDIGNDFDCENNDGKLFIEVTPKGKLKYCFTDRDMNILDGEQYMVFDTEYCYEQYRWENVKDKEKVAVRNIKWLNSHATMMTNDELNEFIHTEFEE